MLFDPAAHVRDGELQVLPEAIRTGSKTAGAPVVDRRDRHAEMGRQFADIEQGLQAPGVVCREVFGAHVEQVRSTHPQRSGSTGAVAHLPEHSSCSQAQGGQKDGFVMTGSNLTNWKVPETLEFPGPLGRASGI